MTNQDQIIIFCVLAVISVPLGTFITIKTINKLSRPPVNALNRTADIELVDYIEPSQPGHAYYPIDLVNNQYPIYERFSNAPTYYSGANPPSFFTGVNPPTLYSGVNHSIVAPSYHTVDRNIINSCLENSINPDFIPWLLILFIFILIIFKYFKINVLKLLIVILFYLKFGIFMNSFYIMSVLIPFCTFDIDFRDSFEWRFKSYRVKPMISYHKLLTLTWDIDNLLDSLVDDVNYSMSYSFISSYEKWKDNKDKFTPAYINDAIIVNKESDPLLITQFIMKSLNEKDLFITNWILNDETINSIDPVILTAIVPINVNI